MEEEEEKSEEEKSEEEESGSESVATTSDDGRWRPLFCAAAQRKHFVPELCGSFPTQFGTMDLKARV